MKMSLQQKTNSLALQKKIELWLSSINRNNFHSFSLTQSFIEKGGSEINIKLYISAVKTVLDNLKKELSLLFSARDIR